MRTILSPCQRICKLDPTTDQCTVCGRTMVQIKDWSSYSDDQRKDIIVSIKQKRKNKDGLGSNN